MSLVSVKRFCRTWAATLLCLAVLVVVGFVLAVAMGHNYQVIRQHLLQLPWGGWRVLLYAALLLLWPQVVQLALRQCGHQSSTLNLTQCISRRPLFVLILCYELLVVRNPLAVLIRWLG